MRAAVFMSTVCTPIDCNVCLISLNTGSSLFGSNIVSIAVNGMPF